MSSFMKTNVNQPIDPHSIYMSNLLSCSILFVSQQRTSELFAVCHHLGWTLRHGRAPTVPDVDHVGDDSASGLHYSWRVRSVTYIHCTCIHTAATWVLLPLVNVLYTSTTVVRDKFSKVRNLWLAHGPSYKTVSLLSMGHKFVMNTVWGTFMFQIIARSHVAPF